MTFSHIKGFVADFFVYKKCYPRRYVGSMVAGRMEGKGELFFIIARFFNLLAFLVSTSKLKSGET